MPYGGMWDMTWEQLPVQEQYAELKKRRTYLKRGDLQRLQLAKMQDFKRCSGYKGHHECVDEYPDHMVPVSEFCSDRCSKDKLHHLCHKCMRYRNKIHSHTRIKHPLTGENKDDWKRRMAISAGGVIGTPEWKSYLEKADAEWGEEVKGHLLNTAPAQEVIAFIESTKSEFGQSKPMTKRTTTKVEGETVPEGWVYIVRNPDVPHILKIGKTFPDGIPDIMSSARRFGRAELINKYWFEEALKSEKLVHEELKPYNLRVLGYTDCGKELFKCGVDDAVSAVNEVKKNWQYQKTSGGLIKNTPIGLQHSLA